MGRYWCTRTVPVSSVTSSYQWQQLWWVTWLARACDFPAREDLQIALIIDSMRWEQTWTRAVLLLALKVPSFLRRNAHIPELLVWCRIPQWWGEDALSVRWKWNLLVHFPGGRYFYHIIILFSFYRIPTVETGWSWPVKSCPRTPHILLYPTSLLRMQKSSSGERKRLVQVLIVFSLKVNYVHQSQRDKKYKSYCWRGSG